MPFVDGETIGPYRLMEKLGRGGMATVFKAYHAALDRYVAIKALHPAFMADPNFLARFQREARVVARLEHQNIVPIYDFAEHEGRPYLVMKFIDGETLKAYLLKTNINSDEILRIARAVAGALAYAHGKGVLHRDVKPSNVLIGNDDQIYLADFGLARMAEAGESTLSSDMMLGTPQYISPEQAMGVSELDDGTDIYSFGVMLYEILVGQVPFSADTPFSIIHDHIYTPLPMPRQVNANVPEGLERVLLKALSKERADRFENVAAMLSAFEGAIFDTSFEVTAARGILVNDAAITAPVAEPEQTIAAIGSMDEAAVPEKTMAVDALMSPGETIAIADGADGIAAPEQGAASVLPDEKVVPVSRVKKRRPRRRWGRILLGIVAVAACGFLALVALAKIAENRNTEGSPSPMVDVGEDAMPFPEGDALARAYQNVEQNPDDPYALIELALALFEHGDMGEAEIMVDEAMAMSDNDYDFLVQTAEMMAERETWLGAARMYLHIVHIYPDQFYAQPQMKEKFRQAAFLAAASPLAEENLPLAELAEIDPLFAEVVNARMIFHRGNKDLAMQLVEDILLNKELELPEAWLLKAEIKFDNNNLREGRLILAELQKSEQTPAWILAWIESLIKGDMPVSSSDSAREDVWPHIDALERWLVEENYPEADQELTKIFDLAPDNPAVYRRVAEIFADHGDWLSAAVFYAKALTMDSSDSEALIERSHEAIYFASTDPSAVEILSDPKLFIDGIMLDITKAHHALYHDEIGIAERLINELVRKEPDLPEVRLLHAELLVRLNRTDEAVDILQTLQQDEAAPFWTHEQARAALNEIGY